MSSAGLDKRPPTADKAERDPKRPSVVGNPQANTSSDRLDKITQVKSSEKDKEHSKLEKKIEKERERMDKKIEKEREKLEKEIEKIEKDREKKEKERDKTLEKGIERIERDRDKDEREKDRMERERRDMREAFFGQRIRLHELFGQIEKEFELLWEENAELRRKLDEVKNSGYPTPLRREGSGSITKNDNKSRLNPLKKKDREPEWECLTHFAGHRDGIWDITTCRWEKHAFATASADRTARLWFSDALNPVYIYIGHKGSVNSIRTHPTNRLACTGSGDHQVHIWKVPKPNEKEKGTKEEKQEHTKPWTPLLEKNQNSSEKPSSPLAVSPPNDSITVPPSTTLSDYDGTPIVVTINRSVAELKHKGPVISADWWFNGEKVVSASWDNTVKVWATENSRCLADIDAGLESNDYLTSVDTHTPSQLFITSASDTYLRLYDIRVQQPLVMSIQAHSDVVTSVCFVSSDENIVVSGSDDRTVKVWDKRNPKNPKQVIRCSAGVNRISVSPISSNLVIPLDDGRTKVCDLNGKQLGRLKSETKHRPKLMISSAAWSEDESVIFTAGFDKSVIAWAQPSRFVGN